MNTDLLHELKAYLSLEDQYKMYLASPDFPLDMDEWLFYQSLVEIRDEIASMRGSLFDPLIMKAKEVNKRFASPSVALQYAMVFLHPYTIAHLESPSKSLQKLAVFLIPFSIMFIKEPCEEVQFDAVSYNGMAIFYIQSPSGFIQLTAIKQNPMAFDLIKNPTPRVHRFMAIVRGDNQE